MKMQNKPAPVGAETSDNAPNVCRGDDKASLPREARLPINRCNLPAVMLGSLTFQRYPTALLLDGVAELHHDLFRRLESAAPRSAGRGLSRLPDRPFPA